MPVHTSELDKFVNAVISASDDFADPRVTKDFMPFLLKYDSVVNQKLDPFSDEYYENQISLYKEISGRELDQETGELHPVDIDERVASPNPTGILHVSKNAEQIRAISTLLACANLCEGARILDLGAGAGLSSEIYAYAGGRVHALDIDPDFAKIGTQRAAGRMFAVQRSLLNFSEVSLVRDGPYQAAFFYQSLHHCLRPWVLISDLVEKLDPDGVIGFTGEPVQSVWWKHWGIRLDEVSVYVARRFGWFESGWSKHFIKECFTRNGYHIAFFTGGHSGGEIAIASRSEARIESTRSTANSIGLHEILDLNYDARQFLTIVGYRSDLFGCPAMLQKNSREGTLIHGPYVEIGPGTFEIFALLSHEKTSETSVGFATIDAIADFGSTVFFSQKIEAEDIGGCYVFRRTLEFTKHFENFEFRVNVCGEGKFAVTMPVIQKVGAQK